MPAKLTMKSASFSAASISAMVPPSLWPITPTLSKRSLSSLIPARASSLKSSVVALATSPVEPPTPRSSKRSVAMPLRAKASAMTAKGLCSKTSSSLFSWPLPVTMIRTGVLREYPSGSTSVPASVASPLEKVTSSCSYGNGPTGVCGRFSFASGVSVSGRETPACLNVPAICFPSHKPSNDAPIRGILMVIPPVAVLSTWTGIPNAAWSGESMVGSSPSRWNTMVSFVPRMSTLPDQLPSCAFETNAMWISRNNMARILFILKKV